LKKRPIAVPDVAVLDAEEEQEQEQEHEREEEEDRELSYDNDGR
jgi:hypothetical protein